MRGFGWWLEEAVEVLEGEGSSLSTDQRLAYLERTVTAMAKTLDDVKNDIAQLQTDAANVVEFVKTAKDQLTALQSQLADAKANQQTVDFDALDSVINAVHDTLSGAVSAVTVPLPASTITPNVPENPPITTDAPQS